MALAGYAIDFVLSNEGGFVDSPNDSGGATNFGISLRFLREISHVRLLKYGIFNAPQILNLNDIKELTKDQAIKIYQGEFWDFSNIRFIKDQTIADYVFDMIVMHGEHQATKILQRSLWSVYANKNYNGLVDDGILGDATLTFTNATSARSLQIALRSERAGFMRLLVVERPKDLEFLDGWLARAYRC